MSDEEGYNSEEDVDYVPSEGEQASEEENSGDEEDLSLLKDEAEVNETAPKRKSKTNKKNEINTRKRKGGIKLEKVSLEAAADTKEEENDEEAERRKQLADQIASEENSKRKEKEKKRADDLWSSFMADVKPPSRNLGPSNSLSSQLTLSSEGGEPVTKLEDVGSGKAGKVTITKIFDFAGEEVKVTEEVDANSKEAKAEQMKHEQTDQKKFDSPTQPSQFSLGSGTKRPAASGLGVVLNKINKKSKMGTLEKSKIDWESFKRKEGINDDLKIYNKGKQGYTERVAFLNRADQRQYEIERDLRLGSSSKR
uniref:Craniofacial development protein 1 n=1 Tax=Arion vulgaris TaxID=1028688 RepID=A0A0B7B2S3_9EUPU